MNQLAFVHIVDIWNMKINELNNIGASNLIQTTNLILS